MSLLLDALKRAGSAREAAGPAGSAPPASAIQPPAVAPQASREPAPAVDTRPTEPRATARRSAPRRAPASSGDSAQAPVTPLARRSDGTLSATPASTVSAAYTALLSGHLSRARRAVP